VNPVTVGQSLGGRPNSTLEIGLAHDCYLGASVLNSGLWQEGTGYWRNPDVLINVEEMFALHPVGFCVIGILDGAAFWDSTFLGACRTLPNFRRAERL